MCTCTGTQNVLYCIPRLTSLSPSGLVESIGGCLLKRENILAAEAWALLASGANELALPSDRAVNTTAANVLRERERERECKVLPHIGTHYVEDLALCFYCEKLAPKKPSKLHSSAAVKEKGNKMAEKQCC